jgi:hypothetical protein
MQTTIVIAARPEDLKTAVDAIILAGDDIIQVVTMSIKSAYLIIHKAP